MYTFPNSSYKLCNVHVFARAHFSHTTQLGQPISCCRGSGSVLLQKWLNICYAVAQCRNLLKSSKICSWLLPHLQESMDLIIVSTLKFIYSEKATKFIEIFPLLLTVCTAVKSKGKISQNFVAFSEYTHYILRATLKSNDFLD